MTETPVYPKDKPPTLKPAVAVPLVVGIILLFLLVIYACVPYLESGNHVTYPPPGEQPERFDPFTAIAAIQTQIGADAELVEIRALYVKSDGTQDLMDDAYFAQADYTFVKEVPAPEDAPPVGAGGSATGRWYQRFDVDIYRPGQWRRVSGSENYSYLHKGMDIDSDPPTGSKPATAPLPSCPFTTLWAAAIADGVPPEAVANIEYDADGYKFYISDLAYNANFDTDCQRLEP